MKVRIDPSRSYDFNLPHFSRNKVYKVYGKTRNTLLLRNDHGYLQSVKATRWVKTSYIEIFLEKLFRL